MGEDEHWTTWNVLQEEHAILRKRIDEAFPYIHSDKIATAEVREYYKSIIDRRKQALLTKYLAFKKRGFSSRTGERWPSYLDALQEQVIVGHTDILKGAFDATRELHSIRFDAFRPHFNDGDKCVWEVQYGGEASCINPDGTEVRFGLDEEIDSYHLFNIDGNFTYRPLRHDPTPGISAALKIIDKSLKLNATKKVFKTICGGDDGGGLFAVFRDGTVIVEPIPHD